MFTKLESLDHHVEFIALLLYDINKPISNELKCCYQCGTVRFGNGNA